MHALPRSLQIKVLNLLTKAKWEDKTILLFQDPSSELYAKRKEWMREIGRAHV